MASAPAVLLEWAPLTSTLGSMVDLRAFAMSRPTIAGIAAVVLVAVLWSALGRIVAWLLPNGIGPQVPLFTAVVFVVCVGVARLITMAAGRPAVVAVMVALVLSELVELALFETFGQILVTEDELERNAGYFHGAVFVQALYAAVCASVVLLVAKTPAKGGSNAA